MYYIYEIKGVKIGCTKNFKHRQCVQRKKGKMVLLESHINIEDATRRERELQLEKGYPVDDKDYITVNKLGAIGRANQTQATIDQRVANTDYSTSINGLKRVWESKRKKVRVTTKEGKLIGIYTGLNKIARKLGVDISNAACCANPKYKYPKSCNGYVFEYL